MVNIIIITETYHYFTAKDEKLLNSIRIPYYIVLIIVIIKINLIDSLFKLIHLLILLLFCFLNVFKYLFITHISE